MQVGRSRPSDRVNGGGHPDPKISGGVGGVLYPKKFFRPLRPQFGLKLMGGGGGGGRGPPAPPKVLPQ